MAFYIKELKCDQFEKVLLHKLERSSWIPTKEFQNKKLPIHEKAMSLLKKAFSTAYDWPNKQETQTETQKGLQL